jgi:hypothetical protein
VNPRLAHLLTRLYPRAWRERYGEEFEALLQTGRGDLRASANVVWSALHEHIFPTRGGKMDRDPRSFGAIVRQPSAYVPLAMSLTALALLLGALVTGLIQHHPLVREADEGTLAHIWQLLMAGQLPILLYFAIRWLPRAPRQTLYVLMLQAGAVLASMAPVYFLNL